MVQVSKPVQGFDTFYGFIQNVILVYLNDHFNVPVCVYIYPARSCECFSLSLLMEKVPSVLPQATLFLWFYL